MKKSLFLVAFNPYFSRKMGDFWKAKKITPIEIGSQHVLVKTTQKMVENPTIQPYLIRALEMKACKDLKAIQTYIQQRAEKPTPQSLRVWMIGHPTLSGRDIEVKLGQALDKKGVEMNPHEAERVWFVLITPKKGFISLHARSLDDHAFPYQDAKLAGAKTITRSGKKLRFLLHRIGMNVTGKKGVDLGCGSGGWTQTLLEKGAAHVTAIDRTKMDKGLQRNKKVTYIEEKAEKAPKVKGKVDFIVQDINVGPEHAKKIFLQFDRKNPGAKEAVITLKIMGGKDLGKLPKVGSKWGKWKVNDLANSWWARRECYVYVSSGKTSQK